MLRSRSTATRNLGGAVAATLRATVTVVDGPGLPARCAPCSTRAARRPPCPRRSPRSSGSCPTSSRTPPGTPPQRPCRAHPAVARGGDVERRLDHVRVEDGLPYRLVLGRDVAALLDEVTITATGSASSRRARPTPDTTARSPSRAHRPTRPGCPVGAAPARRSYRAPRPGAAPYDARGPPVARCPPPSCAPGSRRWASPRTVSRVVDRTLAFTAGGVVTVVAERAAESPPGTTTRPSRPGGATHSTTSATTPTGRPSPLATTPRRRPRRAVRASGRPGTRSSSGVKDPVAALPPTPRR